MIYLYLSIHLSIQKIFIDILKYLGLSQRGEKLYAWVSLCLVNEIITFTYACPSVCWLIGRSVGWLVRRRSILKARKLHVHAPIVALVRNDAVNLSVLHRVFRKNFVFSKNFHYLATAPSQALCCNWLYKNWPIWPANRSDCTLAFA